MRIIFDITDPTNIKNKFMNLLFDIVEQFEEENNFLGGITISWEVNNNAD